MFVLCLNSYKLHEVITMLEDDHEDYASANVYITPPYDNAQMSAEDSLKVTHSSDVDDVPLTALASTACDSQQRVPKLFEPICSGCRHDSSLKATFHEKERTPMQLFVSLTKMQMQHSTACMLL